MALRVLVAHNRYRSALPSGENTVVEQEIRMLREAGVDVVPLLPSMDSFADEATLWRKLALPVAPIWSPVRLPDVDVVHLHNPYPLISPWIVRAASHAGVPVVQTVHNYRHVCVSGLYFRDGHECHDCHGRVLGTPAIVHACYRGSRAQSAVMATALAVHRSTWRLVHAFLAPNRLVAGHLHDFGIAPDRIVIKPNAVPDPGPPSARGHGVFFAGRLTPEKGVGLLVEACARAGVPLRIAGDGPLRAIGTLGRLSPAQIRDEIRACAVVAVPSLLADVHPTIAIEALANGRPVMGTPMGGIADIIGPAGWIVPPTVDAWARALREALDHDLVDAARARYLARFHPRVVTAQLLDIYRSVLRA